MTTLMQRNLTADGRRFITAGILNSLCSLMLYQLLMFVMPSSFAYSITWILVVGFVAVIYPRHVFAGARTDRYSMCLTALIYVASFGLGLGFITLLDQAWPGNRLSIFAAMAFTTLFNFIMLSVFLRRNLN